jgi:hypothetical protein
MIDFESKKIHRTEYGEVVKDPNNYVMEKFRLSLTESRTGL